MTPSRTIAALSLTALALTALPALASDSPAPTAGVDWTPTTEPDAENRWNSDEFVWDAVATCDQPIPHWGIYLTRLADEAKAEGQVYVLVSFASGSGVIVDKVTITEKGQQRTLTAPEPVEPGATTEYFIYQNNGRPHAREAVSQELVTLGDC